MAARARLVNRHIRYVHKLVGGYRGIGLSPYQLDDVSQEGMVGLCEAANEFDPAVIPLRCFRAFARPHIVGRITQFIARVLQLRDRENRLDPEMTVERGDDVDRTALIDDVWGAVRRLNPFEAWVIIENQGLDCRPAKSILELSKISGLSPKQLTRVRDVALDRMAERLRERRRA
jgi:RNA polymerase sigma factor (sigma-70 family)